MRRSTMMLLAVIIFCGCGEKRELKISSINSPGIEVSNTTNLYQILSNPHHWCATINWKAKYDSLLKTYYLVDVRKGDVYNYTDADTVLFYHLEKLSR